MTCECGSDRIARVRAKHSDCVSISIPAIEYEKDGGVPYVNYANGDRFLGGDYLNLVFCLDCGRIQDFAPITDADIYYDE